MDFRDIIDCIFINKQKYWKILDSDKEKNFFIINKKFSRMYPEIAQIFNYKNMDKSIALDKWFFHFRDKKSIPQWYWNKKKSKINKDKIIGYELIERENISENDLLFLNKYYKIELKKEILKIKKYNTPSKNNM